MREYIDLSHTVFDGLMTYKGLPAPIVCDFLSREASKSFYAEGTSFQIGKIEMVTNTGTYIDCPFHRYEDGKDMSEMSLEKTESTTPVNNDETEPGGLGIEEVTATAPVEAPAPSANVTALLADIGIPLLTDIGQGRHRNPNLPVSHGVFRPICDSLPHVDFDSKSDSLVAARKFLFEM